MQKAILVLSVALFFPWDAVAGPDPNYVLTISDALGNPGDTVTVTCGLDFAAGNAIAGASWGVCSDPAFVTVDCVGGVPNDCVDNGVIVPGITLAATNGGTGPQFFAPATTTVGATGWTLGIVINLLGGDSLAPQDGAELAEAQYQIVGGGREDVNVPVMYCEIGDPVVLISIGVAGGGPDITPSLSDGRITINGTPMGYLLTISDAVGGPGQTVPIQCALDFPLAAAISGVAFGVCSDPALVQVGCSGGMPNDCVDNGVIVPGAALNLTNGGAGPEFFSPSTTGNGAWTVGVVISLGGMDSLPAQEDAELTVTQYKILYRELNQEMNVALNYCEVGDPLVLISVSIAAGGEAVPDLSGGRILIDPEIAPCLMLTCTGGTQTTTISWEVCDPPFPFDFFTLHRDGDLVGLLAGSDSLFVDEDLVPGPYHYEIIGFAFPNPSGPPVFVVADCDVSVIPVTLAAIEPESGTFLGGDLVTLTGTGFLGAPDTAVDFGGVPATDVMIIDDTMLTCVTPAANTLGTVDVTVTNSQGFSTLIDGFLYGFVRGDVNADGEISLADPLFGLEYLFSGGREPVCLDALDTDDDGNLDLQDNEILLRFIFIDGPPPAPPHPEAGRDPTDDDPFRCI